MDTPGDCHTRSNDVGREALLMNENQDEGASRTGAPVDDHLQCSFENCTPRGVED